MTFQIADLKGLVFPDPIEMKRHGKFLLRDSKEVPRGRGSMDCYLLPCGVLLILAQRLGRH